jgi:hypothetical protein
LARHIFQACSVWIYTQSNITQASNSPEYTLHQHRKFHDYLLDHTDIEGT